jgi:hypothetical protein
MSGVAVPTPPPRTRNYLLRHWRGECSLAVSYWINGWVAAIAIVAFALVVSFAMRGGRQPWLYLAGLLLVWSFVIPVLVWQSVGIWRSAARAKQMQTRQFWPVAAQVMVVLGALANLNVLRVQALPGILDAVAYCRGDPAWGPHGIRVFRGRTEIEVSGPLSWGLARQLQATLAEAPDATVVHLDSIGGRIGVALSIADIVAARHLDTYVDHLCASACTLAYLAGQHRWISEYGKLGFHGATLAGAGNPIADASFRQSYERYELPADFLDHVFRTPPNELWFPAYAELASAHVTTGLAPDDMFAVSGFGPQPTQQIAEQRLLELPIYAALQRTDPDWAALMVIWGRTVRNGETITGFAAEARAHVARVALRVLPVAPEDTLRQFANMMLSETETIQRADPEACWRYLHNEQIDLHRFLSPAQLRDELAVSARLLRDATDHPQPRLSPEDSRALLARLISAMRLDGRDPDAALAGLRPGALHVTYCAGFDKLISAALAWPRDDGGSPLRALFSLR